MAKYSLTKGPVADNVWALTKDPDATKIEITKNPGFDTVAFSKNAATQVSLENAGGGGGIGAVAMWATEDGDTWITEDGDDWILE